MEGISVNLSKGKASILIMCKYTVSRLDFCQLDTCQGHLGKGISNKEKCLRQIGKSVRHFLLMTDVGVQPSRGSATWGR